MPPARERISVPRTNAWKPIWETTKMSHSSTSELEKEQQNGDVEKETAVPRLTEAQEDLIEAGAHLPFTEKEDVERNSEGDDGVRDGGEGGGDDGALSRVSSRPSVSNIKSVPNGGLRAWLQVLSTFFVFFNVSSTSSLAWARKSSS